VKTEETANMVVVVRVCGSCVVALDLTPFLSANHQFKMI
jgi:hypothetical protein